MNETLQIILTILFWLAVSGIIMWILSYFIVGYILFVIHLKRNNKSKWTRACSSNHPRHLEMYEYGRKWSQKYAHTRKDLHIINEGLNLYGEYYDLGFDRAVILLSGRTEGLCYNYYFADNFSENGYNVLTIDQRAHGESDGKYNTLGFDEHRDTIAWAKYIKENLGVKSIILSGICIGGACGLQAVVSPEGEELFDGLVVEGMYQTFSHSFANHMIELEKKVYPTIYFVDLWMKVFTGHSMLKGNIDIIHKMHKPLLMLNSLEDKYSLPEKAQELYDKCPAEGKKLVFFDHGDHSMIRCVDKEKYDNAIKEFINKHFD